MIFRLCLTTQQRSCILEFDGASKGNPGKSGAGVILRAQDGSVVSCRNFLYVHLFICTSWLIFSLISCLFALHLKVSRIRQGLGFVTNNVAEYQALILGLNYALSRGFMHIVVRGDSQLVCMQVCYSSNPTQDVDFSVIDFLLISLVCSITMLTFSNHIRSFLNFF